jgi:hypothetical protein
MRIIIYEVQIPLSGRMIHGRSGRRRLNASAQRSAATMDVASPPKNRIGVVGR